MTVTSTTTHTARCDRCRWTKSYSDRRLANAGERAHVALHQFKKGDHVEAPRSISCRFATIKYLFFDQDRAVIEASPRREIICHSCPHHDEHGTGTYVTDTVPISSLVATSNGSSPSLNEETESE